MTTDNKTWSGRFNEPVSELVKQYTASINFDQRLARHDIQGSLAHAQMLHEAGVLSAQDLADIRRGMAEIQAEIEAGSLQWSLDLEDVHMNIERRLTDKIGDAGKRLPKILQSLIDAENEAERLAIIQKLQYKS